MMAIWGDDLDAVPPAPGDARSVPVPADLCQSDVDRYIDMDASSADPIPPPAAPPAVDDGRAQDIVFLDPAEPATALSPVIDAQASDAPAEDIEGFDTAPAEPEIAASEHEGAGDRIAEPKAAEIGTTEADAMDSAAFALAQGAEPDEARS